MYQSVFVVLKYDYLTQLWELFVIDWTIEA